MGITISYYSLCTSQAQIQVNWGYCPNADNLTACVGTGSYTDCSVYNATGLNYQNTGYQISSYPVGQTYYVSCTPINCAGAGAPVQGTVTVQPPPAAATVPASSLYFLSQTFCSPRSMDVMWSDFLPIQYIGLVNITYEFCVGTSGTALVYLFICLISIILFKNTYIYIINKSKNLQNFLYCSKKNQYKLVGACDYQSYTPITPGSGPAATIYTDLLSTFYVSVIGQTCYGPSATVNFTTPLALSPVYAPEAINASIIVSAEGTQNCQPYISISYQGFAYPPQSTETVQQYYVCADILGQTGCLVASQLTNANTYTFYGLQPQVAYNFSAQAVDPCASIPRSAYVSVVRNTTTVNNAPIESSQAVLSLTNFVNENLQTCTVDATLQWRGFIDPVTNAQYIGEFEVCVTKINPCDFFYGIVLDTTQVVLPGMAAGYVYNFTVTAINSCGIYGPNVTVLAPTIPTQGTNWISIPFSI